MPGKQRPDNVTWPHQGDCSCEQILWRANVFQTPLLRERKKKEKRIILTKCSLFLLKLWQPPSQFGSSRQWILKATHSNKNTFLFHFTNQPTWNVSFKPCCGWQIFLMYFFLLLLFLKKVLNQSVLSTISQKCWISTCLFSSQHTGWEWQGLSSNT